MTAAFKVYCGVAVVYYHDGAVHYCDVTDYCTVDAVISIEEDYVNISITKFVSEHFSGYSCLTLELKTVVFFCFNITSASYTVRASNCTYIYARALYYIGIYEIWHHCDSLSHLQTTKHLMLDFFSSFQQTFRMPLYEREYNVPIRKSMQNDANRSEYYSFNNQSIKHRCFIRINKSYNITNFFHVFYLSFG